MSRIGWTLLGGASLGSILLIAVAAAGSSRGAGRAAAGPGAADPGAVDRGAADPAVARTAPAAGAELVAQLGCSACHAGLPISASPQLMRERAPSLASAGLRYRTPFLYVYLGEPFPVRPHILPSRMPDFRLEEGERVALALYLESLEAPPPGAPATALPRISDDREERGDEGADLQEGERLVRGELGCLGCHTLDGRGAGTASALESAGARLRVEWLRGYLADPEALDPGTPMPALLFEWPREAQRPVARVPGAARKLEAIARFLVERGRRQAAEEERSFEAARRRHPGVSAEQGAHIFRALNCGGCHAAPRGPRPEAAPDLSRAGDRLRPEWLRRFLAQPFTIRPTGHPPGAGGRMPDFRLAPSEVEAIAEYLEKRGGAVEPYPPFAPRELSPYLERKAETLVRDRLPCLGCHRLGEEGGRIGPDLSAAGSRLKPGYLREIIEDPGRAAPGTVMPAVPMPKTQRELVASYLAGRRRGGDSATDRSPVDQPLQEAPGEAPSPPSTGAALYARYCASCHGLDGRGDGYNAALLPVRPTRHTDSAYMATLPDDALFDAVHAGGRVMGRSHRMPGFGGSLSAAQIRALVAHMRELCRCEGPGWSRDGAGR